ncbi:7897_t:CDS:2 [Paraglomus brasilianum]|uniref:7897_t:CDS:1 n=1 Tax=Paraglomus brasilianum TaxID=144538 RepID=A0A9N9ANE7_9GLOM|nr:7897_t:CDS:2 [Paraglomus brasilianum]
MRNQKKRRVLSLEATQQQPQQLDLEPERLGPQYQLPLATRSQGLNIEQAEFQQSFYVNGSLPQTPTPKTHDSHLDQSPLISQTPSLAQSPLISQTPSQSPSARSSSVGLTPEFSIIPELNPIQEKREQRARGRKPRGGGQTKARRQTRARAEVREQKSQKNENQDKTQENPQTQTIPDQASSTQVQTPTQQTVSTHSSFHPQTPLPSSRTCPLSPPVSIFSSPVSFSSCISHPSLPPITSNSQTGPSILPPGWEEMVIRPAEANAVFRWSTDEITDNNPVRLTEQRVETSLTGPNIVNNTIADILRVHDEVTKRTIISFAIRTRIEHEHTNAIRFAVTFFMDLLLNSLKTSHRKAMPKVPLK